MADKNAPKNLEDYVASQSKELDDDMAFTLNEDGSVEVEMNIVEEADDDVIDYNSDDHYKNLVEDIDEVELKALAVLVIDNVEADEIDRSEWLGTLEMGLDLIGVKVKEENEPFEGACGAQHPLLMESSIKFQSKASNELLPADGPVQCKVLGVNDTERADQALRVAKHMNYQLTEEMTEFYPDMERLLLFVPLFGTAFKKTYYDGHLERPVSELVTADVLIVPNSASDLHRAPRYTHVLYKSEYELEADFAAGLYDKPEDGTLGDASEPELTDLQLKANALIGVEVGVSKNNEVYSIYEQHVDCHIEGLDPYEGKEDFTLASPYIITVDKSSGVVLGVRRNWRKDDAKRKKKMVFTHYNFVPAFGFYSFGYLHLLGNLQLTLTSTLRSLVDAGQFANLQGGFKLKGVRITGNGDAIGPGEFKEIESVVQDISKAIMPLPFKEPSTVLFQMLDFLDRKGQKFADSADQVIADASNQGPVGTTMALLDASTKFFSAIHKRLHKSLKDELRLLGEINAETLPSGLEYNLSNETIAVSRADYDKRVDVVPISDPNISSSAHRMTKAQTILQAAQMAPDIYDTREVHKHFLISMDFDNIDSLIPPEEEASAQDPMSDIRLASEGKPIKAFKGQNHEAHISMKMAFMQDPKSGGSPMMQRAGTALQANLQEHYLLQFEESVQAQTELSGAPQEQAAQQVAQMNQQEAIEQQKKAEENSQNDAARMIAQAELMDTETNKRKQEFDEVYKTGQLELGKEKIDLEKLRILQKDEHSDKKIIADQAQAVQTKGLDLIAETLRDNYVDNRNKE
tara:strand:+ start:2672 stop:5080 length:2409 start_codon:yes stop_codon:yes gene_type:complete